MLSEAKHLLFAESAKIRSPFDTFARSLAQGKLSLREG